MAGGYEDDELGPEEAAALNSLEENDRKIVAPDDAGGVPGVLSDQDEQDPAKVAALEAPAADPATPPPAVDPAADPAAPVADTPPANETLAQFMTRHRTAGKSDEEIAELVENRGKRQAREGFQRRRGRTAEQIAADRTAIEAKKGTIKGRSETFNAKLTEDPDEAARLLHEENVARDLAAEDARLAQLDDEEFTARQDAAIDQATQWIPDLDKFYPQMQTFGRAINYTDEELGSISDARDLLTLDFATRFANLLEAKKVDRFGNVLPTPAAVNDTPSDPRLRAPAPPATHTAPSGVTAAPPSQETQINSALAMTDEEFAKLPDAEINRIMGGR